jgi:hypothetical protein
MMKTEMQIERDFYSFVKQSIGTSIAGNVYRFGMRPANAVTEDAVVKFLSGYDEQIQTGFVLLHVYIPEIVNADGRSVADLTRIGEVEDLINDFVRTFDDTDYLISTDGTPYYTFNEELGQYLVVARIRFQRITND